MTKIVIDNLEKRVSSLEDQLSDIKKEVDADQIEKDKKRISGDISLLKNDISQGIDEVKEEDGDDSEVVKKLQALSDKVDSFDTELASLKDQVVKKEKDKGKDKNKEEEGNSGEDKDSNKEKDSDKDKKNKEEDAEEPSLFSSIFYGGLIGSAFGSIPFIGKSIKSWANKKVKASAKEKADIKSGKKEKKSFFGRIMNTVLWSGIATGALWLGRKLIPDSWMKEVKSRLPWTDEAKAKKAAKEQGETKPDETKIDETKPNGNVPVNNENSNLPAGSIVENSDVVAPEVDNPDDVVLSPEEQQTTQEVKKMYSEGYSELYIVTKMYQMGAIPKFNMETWRGNTLGGKVSYIGQGGPFTKMLDKSVKMRSDVFKWMVGKIKYTSDGLTRAKLDAIRTGNIDLKNQFDGQIKSLTEMHTDLTSGKIKSLKEFEAKYGKEVSSKLGRKNFNNYAGLTKNNLDKLNSVEENVKKTQLEIDEYKKKATLELEEIEKKIKANPDQKVKLKSQAEAKKIVTGYNKNILQAEKDLGMSLAHASSAELITLQTKYPLVKGLSKINNGLDKFAEKTKLGKFMIGFSVLSLITDGASGETSWGQVGLEAADLATGMIPFVGGGYDIWTSISGEGFAGTLSTGDRWVRGIAGAGSLVLDVLGLVSFGLGNAGAAALKGATRGGSAVVKIASKSSKIVKGVATTADVIRTSMKVATFGMLGYSLVSQAVPIASSALDYADKKTTPDIVVK